MDAELKAEWVRALRSRKYKQHRNGLRHPDATKKTHLCCIGVGLDALFPEDRGDYHSTKSAAQKPGLTDKQKDTLVDLNDAQKQSFRKIADYIEENL